MRDVDRRLTFWMAGYYDDFIGARAVPDDQNIQGTDWQSSKTHHGNPINGWATLNPRYTYAWCERGDGASGRFNNSAIATADQYNHNAGIHEWLTYDQNRREAGKYEGLAQLQYPDSLSNANRQRFDGGTGILGEAYKGTDANDGFLMFCYGYDTTNRYFSAIGSNDSTFGRATSRIPDYNGGSPNALDTAAGIPTGVSTPTTAVRTHLAGVYSGEVLFNDAYTTSTPKAYLYPIKSPAGKPFLVTEVYTSSASYIPIFSYDGTLNSKGDGDIFTIRIHATAVDTSAARLKLRIGCEGTAFTSTGSGDTGYTNAAIEYEITPVAYQESTSTSYASPPTLDSIWDDYDFVIDYTNNQYTLYKNGTAILTNQAMTNKADGSAFTAADMYGWEVDAKSCSKKAAMLIDRVGLVRPLNDYPSGLEMPPATSMRWSAAVNSVSSLSLDLIDDDQQLKLLSFFNQSSYADWSLLMFRGDIARPVWRGSVNGMRYTQSASDRTPKITLDASDYFSSMDTQLPTWELGNSGDADSTSVVAYNRSESQNNLNTYYFGASRLVSANAGLGFNEVEDGSGVFLAHKDSRMRNRSAHPIQMYGNEDTTLGPNTPYADWDAACVAIDATASAQYRALHSRWMLDLKESAWFKHMFGRIEKDAITTTLSSNFTVGDTSIALTDYCGNLLNGGSIEIIDSDGFVDSGVVTSATHTTATSIVAIDWVSTSQPTGTFGSGARTPPEYHAFVYIDSGVSANIANNVITIAGSSNSNLNGQWYARRAHLPDPSGAQQLLVNRNGVSCARFTISDPVTRHHNYVPQGRYNSIVGHTSVCTFPRGKVYTTNPTQSYIIPTFNPNTNKVVEVVPTPGATQYQGTTAVAPATNFFQRDHASGTTVKVRDIKDDYKHIWVMWADMRNDGSANADANLRKNDFGLLAPYASNYSVSLVYADSNTTTGEERQEFIDLSIGDDLTMWSMDAEKDPITGNTWSSAGSDSFTPTSFTGSDDTRYQNWQDKAGSFIILDTSAFFNLNTQSNGGRTGQIAGGRKEVGDYLVETEGFPVLIDNYWVKAPTGPYNLDEGDSDSWNSNYKFFNSAFTTLAEDIQAGDRVIQLNDDIIKFPLQDTDPTLAGQIVSHEKNKIFHFAADLKIPAKNGITVTYVGNNIVKLTGTGSSGISFKGNNLRTGHHITITNSTTTPSIDGTYEIIGDNGVRTLLGYELQIDVGFVVTNAPASATKQCTFDVAFPTYMVDAISDLGMPNPSSTQPGDWNGAAYGGTSQSTAQSAEALIFGKGQVYSEVTISTDPEIDSSYPDATVYVGLAQVFPMRMMMQIDGFIENKASMTYYDSDKFRVSYLDSLSDNWLQQSTLHGMPSLASIPLTNSMTTSQLSVAQGGLGGYIASTSATISDKVIVVGNNTHDPPELQPGDIIEIVDNAQLSDATDNYRTRYVVTDAPYGGSPFNFRITAAGKTATIGDGYWRKVGQIDTFATVNDCRNTSIANIYSTTQQGSGVGIEDSSRSVMSWLMGRDSQPSFRPTYSNGIVLTRDNLRVSNLTTEGSTQISNVRVFYAGGTSYVDFPSATLGTKPRWEIIHVAKVTSSNEAMVIAKQEYAKNRMAPMSINATMLRFNDNHTLDGLNDLMLSDARYGYVADQSRTIPRTSTVAGVYTEDKAWAWFSLWGGNLFPGIQNALDGRNGATVSHNGTPLLLDYDDNYYWYGANSVSYAMQIVHIPKGMPKTSDKTPGAGKYNADGHLRIVIDIEDGQGSYTDINNTIFRVRLLDYEWDAGILGAVPTLRSSTSVSVAGNGYYQLAIPSTYWAAQESTERIIVSINHDYLVSLVRQRCGTSNTHLNSHDWAGVTYTAGFNADSIFPLGARKFGEADYWNKNSEWYAPRLHIVDDLNFMPATTLTYTDEALELTNEKMSIKSLDWSIDGRGTEQVNLKLERDVSRAAKNFASYILPRVSRGGQQSAGQGNQGGGTGGGGGGQSTSGGTTGGRNGTSGGEPSGGNWRDWGGWGDGGAAQTSSSELNPNTTPGRTNLPDGLSGSIGSILTTTSSSMGTLLRNRVSGTMNFNNDSVTGGSFGVLGQTKTSPPPRDSSGISGIDSFITPSSGDAVMGEDGMSFPGGGSDAGWTSPATRFNITARIPAGTVSNSVRVVGRVSMAGAGQTAVLLVTVTCNESSRVYERTVSITEIERGNVVLFTGDVDGADVASNTLTITIERNPATGDDDAKYASVQLHNVQVATDNRAVQGSSESSSYSYSE